MIKPETWTDAHWDNLQKQAELLVALLADRKPTNRAWRAKLGLAIRAIASYLEDPNDDWRGM